MNGIALLSVRGVLALLYDELYLLVADERPCLTRPFSDDGIFLRTSPMLDMNVATWSKYCHISLRKNFSAKSSKVKINVYMIKHYSWAFQLQSWEWGWRVHEDGANVCKIMAL